VTNTNPFGGTTTSIPFVPTSPFVDTTTSLFGGTSTGATTGNTATGNVGTGIASTDLNNQAVLNGIGATPTSAGFGSTSLNGVGTTGTFLTPVSGLIATPGQGSVTPGSNLPGLTPFTNTGLSGATSGLSTGTTGLGIGTVNSGTSFVM